MNEQRKSYPAAIKWLHWIVAAIVLTLIPVGIVMHNLKPGPAQDTLYFWHKSFGVLVLLLMLVRLAVRLTKGAPPPAAVLTPFERIASVTAHRLLYVLLILMPLIGWLGVSAFDAPADFFGLFQLPPLMGKNEDFAKLVFTAHMAGALALIVVLVAHIGGALRHALRGDGVIRRMLP